MTKRPAPSHVEVIDLTGDDDDDDERAGPNWEWLQFVPEHLRQPLLTDYHELARYRANRRSWWTTKDRDIVDKYQDLLGPEASQQSNVFLMLALSTILKRDPQDLIEHWHDRVVQRNQKVLEASSTEQLKKELVQRLKQVEALTLCAAMFSLPLELRAVRGGRLRARALSGAALPGLLEQLKARQRLAFAQALELTLPDSLLHRRFEARPTPSDAPHFFFYAPDVSQGTSPLPISCVNDVDHEPFPLFKWIARNVYVPPITEPDVSFLTGCTCEGNCVDPAVCTCLKEMQGELAYDEYRRVVRAPGLPIYECTSVCSCGPNCSNRVVQNGSELPLQIFRSPDKGWAVRALSDVRRGQFVCEYLGELITSEEADRRGYQLAHPETSYLYELDFAHGQEDSENQEAAYVLDATEMGGVARFLNHSCDPNLASYSVWVDDLDPGRPRIAFFALRDIRANEELHFNYQMVGALSRDIPCYCGARNCRKFLS